jgi:drug/metabolite transporter (DMT)-like permease
VRRSAQPLQAYWHGLPANGRGALFMLAAASCFAVNGALIKILLASDLHPLQITFVRLLVGVVGVLPFVWRAGAGALKTRHPGIHALRALAGGGAMVCGIAALDHLRLADFTALSFSQPLFAVILAVLLLGETVGWRRWGATLIGFLGVVIMVRPGGGAFHADALLAVAMAFGIAVAVILVKRLPAEESQVTMLFYFSLTTVIVFAAPALAVWRAPTAAEAVGLIGFGVAGLITQAFMIAAYRAGEASVVAPFDYSKLILAGILGFALFGEVPDRWTLIGAAVIIAATLYIARREAVLGKLAKPHERTG